MTSLRPMGVLVRSVTGIKAEILPSVVRPSVRAGAPAPTTSRCRRLSSRGARSNTPGANANAVKELVLAGMLMAARNIAPALLRLVADRLGDGRHGPRGRGRQEGLRRIELAGHTPGTSG